MKKFILLSLFSVCCDAIATAQPTYSLAQLKDSARQHNASLLNAQRSVEAARQQRKEAFTKYFPNVSATGMTFNANKGMAKMEVDPSSFITPEMGSALAQVLPMEALAALQSPIGITMMKNGTLAGVTALQPVFAGGQIVNGNKLAKVGEEVSRLQLRLTENEVDKQVEQYYWQLVSLEEKTKTIAAVKRRKIEQQKAEEQLRDGSELLRIRMQKAYNDVTEAQQQLQLAQQGITQAEENLRLHRDYYRAGTATMSNLLEAQLLYQQTLDRRTDAYAELQNKLLEYRQATGQ